MARDTGIIAFPTYIPPKSITVTMDRVYFRGPKPLAGREQTVIDPSGGWKIRYNDIPLYKDTFQAYNVIMGLFASGSNYTYVRPIAGPYKLANRVGVANISSHVLYYAVAKGATTITVTRSGAPVAGNGDYFELNGRLHRIIYATFNTLNGAAYDKVDTWSFWPPTRAAYAQSTAIELIDPCCLCSVMPDSSAWETTMDLGTIGYQSIDFIEASWPSTTQYP